MRPVRAAGLGEGAVPGRAATGAVGAGVAGGVEAMTAATTGGAPRVPARRT
ncbi:Uncharacterised protein [Mycobacteroides abscessus]|nr:Uncharacterised protein [Mycobacteroides abscessus]